MNEKDAGAKKESGVANAEDADAMRICTNCGKVSQARMNPFLVLAVLCFAALAVIFISDIFFGTDCPAKVCSGTFWGGILLLSLAVTWKTSCPDCGKKDGLIDLSSPRGQQIYREMHGADEGQEQG